MIQSYADALGPFKEAKVLMSGEKYPTLPFYILIVKGLIKATEDFIMDNGEKKCSSLGKKLLTALKERFNDNCENKNLILAMISDPRYKNRLFSCEEKINV